MEKIEIKVETSTVTVLKEVFGFREAIVSNNVGVAVTATERDLDTREDEAEKLTTIMDEPLGDDIDPGRS